MPSVLVRATGREIALTGGPSELEVHLVGPPPGFGHGAPKELPPAFYVVVFQDPADGNVFLVRGAADGSFAGDTWHLSRDEAKSEAARLFPALSPWVAVPDEVEDLPEFVRAAFAA